VAAVVWSGQTDDEIEHDEDASEGGEGGAAPPLSARARLVYVALLAGACRRSVPLVCALAGRLHCDPLASSTAKSTPNMAGTPATAAAASAASSFSLALGAPDIKSRSGTTSGTNGTNTLGASIFTENEPPATLAVRSAYQDVKTAAIADCNGLLKRLVAELRLAVLGQDDEDSEGQGDVHVNNSTTVPGLTSPASPACFERKSGSTAGTAQQRSRRTRGSAPFLRKAKLCRGALDISSLRAALPELVDLCDGLQVLDRAHAAQPSPSSTEPQSASAVAPETTTTTQKEKDDDAGEESDASDRQQTSAAFKDEGKSQEERGASESNAGCSILIGVVAEAQRLVTDVLSRVATAAFANTKAELSRQATSILLNASPQPKDYSKNHRHLGIGVSSPMACAWAFHCLASGRLQQDNAQQQGSLPPHLAHAIQASLAALSMNHQSSSPAASSGNSSSILIRDRPLQQIASTASTTRTAVGAVRLPELLSIALLTALDACVVGAPSSQGNRSSAATSSNGLVLRGCAHAALEGAQACAQEALALLQAEAQSSEAMFAGGTATTAAAADSSASSFLQARRNDTPLNLWDLVGFGEPIHSNVILNDPSDDAAAVAALKRRDLVALIRSAGSPVPLHAAGLSSRQASAVKAHVQMVQRSKEASHTRVENLVQLLGREAALAAIARGSRAGNNNRSSSGSSSSSNGLSESESSSSMTSAETSTKQLVAAHHASCAQERRSVAHSRQTTLTSLQAGEDQPLISFATSEGAGIQGAGDGENEASENDDVAGMSERHIAAAILDRFLAASEHGTTTGSRALLRLLGGHQDDEENDPDLPRLRAAAAAAIAAHRACNQSSRSASSSGSTSGADDLLVAAADCARVAAVVLPQTAQRLEELLLPSRQTRMEGGSSFICLADERKAFASLGKFAFCYFLLYRTYAIQGKKTKYPKDIVSCLFSPNIRSFFFFLIYFTSFSSLRVLRRRLIRAILGACLLARHHVFQLAALRKVARHGWRPWPMRTTTTTTMIMPSVPSLPSYMACVLQALVDANASLVAQFGAANNRSGSSSSSSSSFSSRNSNSNRSNGHLNEGSGHGKGSGALFQGTAAASFGHLAGAALLAIVVCAEGRLAASSASAATSTRSTNKSNDGHVQLLTPIEARMRAVEISFFTNALLPLATQACVPSSSPLTIENGSIGVAAGATSRPPLRHGSADLAKQYLSKDCLIALEARAHAAGEALRGVAGVSAAQVHEQVAEMQEHAGLYLACFP